VLSLISFDKKAYTTGSSMAGFSEKLRGRGILEGLLRWIDTFCSTHTTTIVVNGFTLGGEVATISHYWTFKKASVDSTKIGARMASYAVIRLRAALSQGPLTSLLKRPGRHSRNLPWFALACLGCHTEQSWYLCDWPAGRTGLIRRS